MNCCGNGNSNGKDSKGKAKGNARAKDSRGERNSSSPEGRNARETRAPGNRTGTTTATVPGAARQPRQPPIISSNPIPDVNALAESVASRLNPADNENESATYALIGGVAIELLGYSRGTADVDILVPSVSTAKKVARLLKTGRKEFFTFPRGGGRPQVWWRSLMSEENHNVDIMVPVDIKPPGHGLTFPDLAKDPDGVIVHKETGVKILKPALLLNYKCYSYPRRDGNKKAEKQFGDAHDIRALVSYMASHDLKTTPAEAPHAVALINETDFLKRREPSLELNRQHFADVGL